MYCPLFALVLSAQWLANNIVFEQLFLLIVHLNTCLTRTLEAVE